MSITYRLIHDCARCMDCDRNVHDFSVPDELWQTVVGDWNAGVLCYDCFCNRADELTVEHGHTGKWRADLVWKWDSPDPHKRMKCMTTAKDETAIFFFEEAIKSDPSQTKRIIAIAKRSPGYSSSKSLQKRVKEEEGKI